jgi:DNA-binding MarR family transcriptional regulator
MRTGQGGAFATVTELTRDQYIALARFRYALREFLEFSEVAAGAHGVTTQQYQALLALKASENRSLNVRELAAELLIKHNGAVQLVDRLADAGLVRRQQSSEDRRVVSIQMTAKGDRKLAELASIHFRELLARRRQLTGVLELAARLSIVKA